MRQFALYFIFVFLAAIIAAPASAQAQKRIALVIGNAAYSGKLGALDNPLNDITLVASSLRSVGFEVMEPVKNATRADILLAIYQFTAKLKAAGPKAVGFFYYAGHGIASGGANYLIPVDVQSTKGWVLNVKGVKLDEITRLLRDNAPKANHFVVFDACRNELRGARGTRGFVPVKDRAGMLIAFSSAPGETADDGDGAQGPYAAALASELLKPGQDHLHLFQRVKSKVYQSTGGQVPWERNGLLDLVYLGGTAAPPLAKSENNKKENMLEIMRKRLASLEAQLKKNQKKRQRPIIKDSKPSPKSPNDQYLVQFATRTSNSSALAAFDHLKLKYPTLINSFKPDIQRADLGSKGVWYRVRVGPLTTMRIASKLCAKLKIAGHPGCFVRKK